MVGGDQLLNETVEKWLIDERFLMEKLLVYEVEAWEGLVWNRVKEFMGRNDVPESGKEQLRREWRGNCWKSLNTNIRAMDARMERAKSKISAPSSNELQPTLHSRCEGLHDKIRIAWQSLIERFVDTPTPSASSTPWSRFDEDVQGHVLDTVYWWSDNRQQAYRQHPEMARRLKKELADVEFRIAQGLDRCDQFFDDRQLLQCRHSRSKSLFMHEFPMAHHGIVTAPLDFYSRALKGNDDAIHIASNCGSDQQYDWLAETIRNLPSVTSIWVWEPERLPPIQRDTPLFIGDYLDSQVLEAFLNNDQLLARTRNTYVFMGHPSQDVYGSTVHVAVSFFGPPSGNLILRIKHRARGHDKTLIVPGTSFTLNIPDSLTIDDITLHPTSNSSSELSFMPDVRNNLIIQLPFSTNYYTLQYLELLDENGNLYGQPSQCNIPPTELDALNMPDNHEFS
jgi:hypothetical protein